MSNAHVQRWRQICMTQDYRYVEISNL